MAEQLIERRTIAASSGFQGSYTDSHSLQTTALATPSESLRQAKSCLETSGRRLRKGEPEQADEVLMLLRAATHHLRQAMAPTSGE